MVGEDEAVDDGFVFQVEILHHDFDLETDEENHFLKNSRHSQVTAEVLNESVVSGLILLMVVLGYLDEQ